MGNKSVFEVLQKKENLENVCHRQLSVIISRSFSMIPQVQLCLFLVIHLLIPAVFCNMVWLFIFFRADVNRC